MNMKTLAFVLAALLVAPPFAHAGKEQALKVFITLLTGAGAAKAMEKADEAHAVYQQKDAVIQNLKSQGIDPTDGAIYSLYFSLNGDASSVYWADTLNKPDIYAVVQIEGDGTFLIPAIQNEYAGQALMNNLIHKHVSAGRRVLVHILDDDSFSDTVWNSILQSTIEYRATAEVSCRQFAGANVEASGKIRLLDRNMQLDAPDYIASAEFSTPSSADGRWLANGTLYDSQKRQVGKLQFAQIWRADPTLIPSAAQAHSRSVFWYVLGGVGLLVAVVVLFSRNQKAAA